MICGVRIFADSRRYFKTSRSVRESPSGHIDRKSYGGVRRREFQDIQ